ncbi:MAG: L,D-transpeptidase [Sandaracinaceae bacterium]|nr:L,D-transpeptidase [Sandaracinaceae bacterium]
MPFLKRWVLRLVVALGGLSFGCGSKESTSPDAFSPPPDAFVSKAPPPPSGPPKRIYVKRFLARVFAAPDPKASRIGYLRAGSVHQAKTSEPVGHEGCRGGWYELEVGGFVCSGREVIAFEGRKLPERPPSQPDLSSELPYRYARVRRDFLPLYRRIPTSEEAARYESFRQPLPPPDPTQQGAPSGTSSPPLPEEPDPMEYIVPTLSALKGKRNELVLRRVLRGFILAIDREIESSNGRRYWKTLANEYLSYNGIESPRKEAFISEGYFRGVVLLPEGEGPGDFGHIHLPPPVGFVMSSNASAYRRDGKGHLQRLRGPGYRAPISIAGEHEINGVRYYESRDGLLFRTSDVRAIPLATQLPQGVGPNDQWIDIDLSLQSLVAYDGLKPVFVTLVSSGRVRDPMDPLRDFRTPTGLFRIASKHITHTMDGDHATDGPYAIQEVPYVMYFQLANALHSAFWHNRFGRPRSHGCVNLSPRDAQWLFHWAGPRLPPGWHGAYPHESNPSAWVYVHGETPEG